MAQAAAAAKAVNDRDTAIRRKAAEQADKLKTDQQQNQTRPPRGRDSKRGEAAHTQTTANLVITLSHGETQDLEHHHRNKLIN